MSNVIPSVRTKTTPSSAAPIAGIESCEHTAAFLLLRLFLGLRTLLAGVEKFEANNSYSFSNYYTNMDRLATGISGASCLPLWAAKSFALPLGYILTVLGVALLLGLKARAVLFFSGLVYVALGFGLMAVQEGEGVAWVGMQVLTSVAALVLVRHNRFALCPDKNN
jgi:thiosulfate dehydrogenase (quinone) large subunit